MDSATLYQQNPVGERQIRVLSFRSKDIRNSASFVVIDLDKPSPPFDALSYHWGDVQDSASPFLTVDGCEIKVTKNCFSALEYLVCNWFETQKDTSPGN
jgi:hypothetical protein